LTKLFDFAKRGSLMFDILNIIKHRSSLFLLRIYFSIAFMQLCVSQKWKWSSDRHANSFDDRENVRKQLFR
jgi:hypothetical protein